ncbi:GNAT family N-acetyltransferase [Sphingomonas parapaucimobilis]|uniref:Putative acetyltransferase n=1 Tax=Sphingomonas parapaucimobilis NBRC 15100 TaxID=1219049 RepID=A0A0A1W6K7_9SPHN|nr:N-acetyltransferase [Sphingomonas parapaucimobilis]GAM00968.1 putative acetyltransferase [Sphingomonas parapaucimobilis NBRC 15100]
MPIRPALRQDHAAIAAIILPVIRAGETYALDPAMTQDAALAYWFGDDKTVFVFEEEGAILGTYYLRANQAGGGDHVANAGYMTSPAARGRGVARAMAVHSFDQARARGFAAMQFNFVVASNAAAVHLWTALGFATVGRVPGAFRHPRLGPVDALVMHRPL